MLEIREAFPARHFSKSKRPTRGSIATDKQRAGEWFVALALPDRTAILAQPLAWAADQAARL
jgi:hypothetical protein